MEKKNKREESEAQCVNRVKNVVFTIKPVTFLFSLRVLFWRETNALIFYLDMRYCYLSFSLTDKLRWPTDNIIL